VVSSNGEISEDIKCRIAKLFHVFDCLRHSLLLSTKRVVYQAIVLAVLLYGAETWTLKAPNIRCLSINGLGPSLTFLVAKTT